MGRKQKLRTVRNIDKNKRGQRAASTTLPSSLMPGELMPVRQLPRTNAIVNATNKEGLDCDYQFPQSIFLEQGHQSRLTDKKAMVDLYERGAINHGCVRCMYAYGNTLCQAQNAQTNDGNKLVHIALPWFLEGAIRGSYKSTGELIIYVYQHTTPRPSEALNAYWTEMVNAIDVDTAFNEELTKFGKEEKERVVQICAVCQRQDTQTLTLQQCMGCSMYCYCSVKCQRLHWEKYNHSGECRQLHILNKYHKPFAKDIRNAVIQGQVHIPALEKLRTKLGLSRPQQDYAELYQSRHNGKPITDASRYLVARPDGKVWVGSTSSPIGHVKWCEDDFEGYCQHIVALKEKRKLRNDLSGVFATITKKRTQPTTTSATTTTTTTTTTPEEGNIDRVVVDAVVPTGTNNEMNDKTTSSGFNNNENNKNNNNNSGQQCEETATITATSNTPSPTITSITCAATTTISTSEENDRIKDDGPDTVDAVIGTNETSGQQQCEVATAVAIAIATTSTTTCTTKSEDDTRVDTVTDVDVDVDVDTVVDTGRK